MTTTAIAALLFCDLVESTALASQLGEKRADEVRTAFFARLREAVATSRGDEVKNLGDGLMVAFGSVLDALACAEAMQVGIHRLSGELAVPLVIRVGVSAGEASRENGDWFGTPVVEAARLCAAAEPGRILVAERAAALTMGRLDGALRPFGELQLKGLAAPLATSELTWDPPSIPVRVTMLGDLEVSGRGGAADRQLLGGAQARTALAYLLSRRRRAVPKEELADAIWGENLPSSWQPALRTIVSKVRAYLSSAGLDGAETVTTAFGCYRLSLPDTTVVDVDEVGELLRGAETAVDDDQADLTAERSARALDLLGRPMLAGEDGPWVDEARADLERQRLRALELLARARLDAGDQLGAVEAAEAAIAADPYRESAHRLAMAAHAASGSRGEALRAYERCRRILAGELGVRPAPETEAAYVVLLGEEPDITPAAAPSTGMASVPVQLTSFVGRDEELRAVDDELAHRRVLTLTGVGGVGKTRLAIEVAHRNADQMHGTWFIDLAAIDDEATVADVFASTLGASTQSGSSIDEAIVGFLGGRSALIVVDNCEHVLDEAGRLVDVIASGCPATTVLATSREPLGVPGEFVFPLEPLAVGRPDDLATSPAARLFVDRARAARGGFDLTNENRSAVGELCEGLEGIPLALELAAARTRTMTPAEIVRRLDRQLSLGGTRHGRSGRHETLRAAIDWSYNLLESTDREVLHRLSVFSGTFDLSAAEAVVAGDGIDVLDVADVLAHLVDKSLVSAKDVSGETRYRLLYAIREYAGGLLGDDFEVRARHARHYTELALTIGAGLLGPDELLWRGRFTTEIDNLRSAISWASANGLMAQAVSALVSLCQVTCALEEVWSWATSSAQATDPPEEDLWPAVLAASAWDQLWRGQLEEASDLASRALSASKIDTPRAAYAKSRVLSAATALALHRAEGTATAHPLAREWHKLAEALGDPYELAQSENMLAVIEYYRGERGTALADAALASARAIGQPTMLALTLAHAVAMTRVATDPDATWDALDEALALARSVHNAYATSTIHVVRAAMRTSAGDARGAALDWLEAAVTGHRRGDRWQTALNIAGVAAELATAGDLSTAATITGWATTVTGRALDPLGNYFGLGSYQSGDGHGRLDLLSERLPAARYAELTRAGQAMSDDEILVFARRALEARGPTSQHDTSDRHDPGDRTDNCVSRPST